jgi:hypothetical protein
MTQYRALPAPSGDLFVLSDEALQTTVRASHDSPRRRIELRTSGPTFGVDLVPGVFHTFLAIEPDTVVYEVKTGPYSASDDKTFARFAPAEGTLEASQYLEHLRQESARRLQH